MRPAFASSALSGCQQHRCNPAVAASAASLRVARKRLLSLAARRGGDHQDSHDSYSYAKPIATASIAFAAAAMFLAPFAVPSAVTAHLSGGRDPPHVARSNLKAELSDLTSWLTEKLRPPEPESANIWNGMALYRNTVVEGVKDAASAAANMAADATNRAAEAARNAAEAAKSAAEASGLASSRQPTDIPPNSELLSSVSKPSPAPGQGPVEAAARAEAKSESSEPALRANTLAAGKTGAKGDCCCGEAEQQSTGKDTCTSRRGD
ncbi:hypothetical protein Vafri_2762 [Volvox africanus]|uniref:Uncharacterized protein n=1 Tax=Volvox africanus TaxID=51714 RepID=A0A8J4ET64_9CHLO|nr:hypothetical protein Vafri_2762 [Volvox africanus]